MVLTHNTLQGIPGLTSGGEAKTHASRKPCGAAHSESARLERRAKLRQPQRENLRMLYTQQVLPPDVVLPLAAARPLPVILSVSFSIAPLAGPIVLRR